MKRVIEIDKDMFNVLRTAEDMDCEVSAEARIINKSLSLNELLEIIRVEIEQDAFDDVNGSKYTFISRVNQIINKYKESEDVKE